ncbi:MAG TPA: RNA polymerase sigma factor [Chloroflexota bacterium]
MTPASRRRAARDRSVSRGPVPIASALDLARERERLVRLCVRLTGVAGVAEDLAQEALTEAVRSHDRLRDPAAASAWLTGIARHVCQRWARRAGRELPRYQAPSDDDEPGSGPVDRVADGFAFEAELDRQELVGLLDRALALLPPDTRAALVLR